MSHIPSSAMPHAKPHDDDEVAKGAGDPSSGDAGLRDAVGEQVHRLTDTAGKSAAAAGEAVKSAVSSVSEQAGPAAEAATEAAKAAVARVNGLPTYAKLIGAAALVGAVAAAVIVPNLPKHDSDDDDAPARKPRKAKRKA